ncbi:MAG TPA: LysE family transporter [Puia sp.]|nr:LysE family transporter [Puia sp.]
MLNAILLGFIISLLGQLPLGTISMTATQIAVQENFRSAWKYSAGIALVEMIYLRLVLSGMQWIISHPLVFMIFNWITIALFTALGIIILIAAQKQEKQKKALLLNYSFDRFLLGLGMSALNPAQIPFWFIWTGYFINLGLLKPGFAEFNLFTLGSGAGTMAGLAIYIYGGNWLVTKMKTSNRTLNKLMGIIFIIAAAAQLYRVLWP